MSILCEKPFIFGVISFSKQLICENPQNSKTLSKMTKLLKHINSAATVLLILVKMLHFF